MKQEIGKQEKAYAFSGNSS